MVSDGSERTRRMRGTAMKARLAGTFAGCLMALLGASPVLGDDIPANRLGRIDAVSLETGQMVVHGRVYALEMESLTVVQNGRALDPGLLRPGMDVAIGVGRSHSSNRRVVRKVKILNQATPLGQDD